MLDAIIADAERRADEARRQADHLHTLAVSAPPARGFAAALARPGPAVIAEIKRRSPSKGDLAPGLDAAGQAGRYELGGAAGVSVLTDPHHFNGSLDDLIDVAGAVDLPVLRKDFLLDPSQVWEARASGADAVLLIVAVLGEERLGVMAEAADAAGLDAFVEVHDENEAELALTVGARLVGVNNRDLKTFDVDLGVAERLAPIVQRPGVVTVAESGVSDRDGAQRMWSLGYDAILVGEALVVSPDAGRLLQELAGP